jgi:hypothetical protein
MPPVFAARATVELIIEPLLGLDGKGW